MYGLKSGDIIRAERRAKGLTRRRLAERLGVPYRTVASWEKGESVPSLREVNLLSEVLGLTPGVIMHGDDGSLSGSSPDVQRQSRRLMAESLSHYRKANFTILSIAVAGVILGTVFNILLGRAWLGFIINAVSIAIGCVAEALAIREARRSIRTDSLQEKHIALYKGSVLKLGMGAYMAGAVFIGWSMPLITMVDSFDEGLPPTQSFMYGSAWGAGAFLIALVVCFVLHGKLIKWGKIPLSDRDRAIYFHNHRLIWILALVFLVLMGLSIYGEYYFTRQERLIARTEFWDVDSFVSYMQKDLRYPYDGSRERGMAVFYVDRRGNPISEDEALLTVLRDDNGNTVCSYLDRNRNVYDIETGDGGFPISVTTYTAIHDAKRIEVMIHTAFAFVYAGVLFAIFVIYLRHRKEHE